jgi:hypothetical protein
MDNRLFVDGSVNIGGDTIIEQSLTVSGDTFLKSDIVIDGSIELKKGHISIPSDASGGYLDMNNSTILNVLDTTDPSSAVTKNYVDTQIDNKINYVFETELSNNTYLSDTLHAGILDILDSSYNVTNIIQETVVNDPNIVSRFDTHDARLHEHELSLNDIQQVLGIGEYAGTTTINQMLQVDGSLNVDGRVDINNDVSMSGDVTIAGDTNLDGNVGIGTAPSSTYKLDVYESLNATTIYENGSTLVSTYANIAGNSSKPFNASTLTLTNSSSTGTISTNYTATETQLVLDDGGETLKLSTGQTPYIGTSSSHDLRFAINDDDKMILTTDGRLGIGTTSPSYTLDVDGYTRASRYYGTGDTDTYISTDPDRVKFMLGTGQFDLAYSSSVAYIQSNSIIRFSNIGSSTSRFQISTNGNVEAYGSIIANYITNNVSSGIYRIISANNNANTGLYGYKYSYTSAGSQANNDQGLVLRVQDDLNALDAVIVKHDGNVGIGTTNPGYTLDVSGTLQATITDNSVDNSVLTALYVAADSNHSSLTSGFGVGIDFKANRGGNIQNNTSQIESYIIDGAGSLSDKWALRFKVRRDDTILTPLTIRSDNDGRVGINTTNPGYTLDVDGSINATTIYENGSPLASTYAAIGGNSTQSFNASTLTLTNSSSTGTISTNYTATETQLVLNDNGETLKLSTGQTPYIGTSSSHNLRFVIYDDDKMILTTDGRLGIGTITPGYKLDVDGTIKASSNIYIGNNAVATQNDVTNSLTNYDNITVADGKYLNKTTGGTITGDLTVEDIFANKINFNRDYGVYSMANTFNFTDISTFFAMSQISNIPSSGIDCKNLNVTVTEWPTPTTSRDPQFRITSNTNEAVYIYFFGNSANWDDRTEFTIKPKNGFGFVDGTLNFYAKRSWSYVQVFVLDNQNTQVYSYNLQNTAYTDVTATFSYTIPNNTVISKIIFQFNHAAGQSQYEQFITIRKSSTAKIMTYDLDDPLISSPNNYINTANYGAIKFNINGSDLFLNSAGNITTTNFTGQHHNYSVNENIDADLKGFIVISTGTYKNQMDNCNECNKYKVTINESLPIVDLSKKSNDKKVFGVISDKDDNGETKEIKHGYISSYKQVHTLDRPLTINSLGEGAIWVCNVNGAIENGDYITSSPIPGLGMIQNDIYLANFTVAKSTMDCEFSGEQVPRKKLRQTPSMIEKTEPKLTQQTDESGNLLTDESGNPVMIEEKDASGNIIKVTVYDESGNPIMIQDRYSNGELKYDPVVDEQGNFIYDFIYDDSGNQLYTDKYESKYVEVFADKYIIYNDTEKTQEFYTYEFDFANGAPDQQTCVGNTYVMAFIGCTYHCG